jgi:aryl-alcohol dehydrogenase-like predicted oxidoreductase
MPSYAAHNSPTPKLVRFFKLSPPISARQIWVRFFNSPSTLRNWLRSVFLACHLLPFASTSQNWLRSENTVPPALGSFFQISSPARARQWVRFFNSPNRSQLASQRMSRPPSPSLRLRFAKLASKRKFLLHRITLPLGSFLQTSPHPTAHWLRTVSPSVISFSSPPLRKKRPLFAFRPATPNFPAPSNVLLSCQTILGKAMTTKRQLGTSEIQIAPLALGGNVFGWTIDQPTSFQILDGFVDAGFTFIDTADIYSTWVPGHKGGESETIIGNWLKQTGKRSEVVIATKVGIEMSPTDKGLSKAYILRAVEASLLRLQTDYIDLYQSHKDDPNTQLAETLEAYAHLIKQGKVRVIGASNYDKNRLGESLGTSEENNWPRYESLQPNYNLYDRADFETNLEPLCLSAKLGVIPYYSLASGFLTGKYRSEKDTIGTKRGQGITKFLNGRGFRILAALDSVSQSHNTNPTRVALAWLMARPSITAPIASATSLAQLKDLTEASNLQLSPEAIQQLNEASAA